MIEKTLRCTVCVWRGSWDTAEAARPVSPSDIPPAMLEVQQAYEDKQAGLVRFGTPKEPACPECGHHTISVRRAPSFHPAM